MLTNPCHRPQVDSATCSSCCSLLFSYSPFLFPCPSLLFPFVLSSSSTLSLSLSLSSPICPPLSLFLSIADISTPPPSLLFLSLSASVPQREKLFYFSVAKLFFPQLAKTVTVGHSRQLKDQMIPEKVCFRNAVCQFRNTKQVHCPCIRVRWPLLISSLHPPHL